MRLAPNVMLILAVPAGLIGYAVGVGIISALPLPEAAQGPLLLFAPLLVAGLFMLPFLIPFFDRMAKRDLAAHRERLGASAEQDHIAPSADPESSADPE
jgi:hypothetical protein